MPKSQCEKTQVLLQHLVVHRHLRELIEHEADVDVELAVDVVGVEHRLQLIDYLAAALYLDLHLVQNLALLKTEARVDLRQYLLPVLKHQVALDRQRHLEQPALFHRLAH